jgi:hypothetical protein
VSTQDAVEYWDWLLQLLERLGPEGCSSDETDNSGFQTVYRVKVMYWRRHMDNYMQMIDDCSVHPEVLAQTGPDPRPRIHINPAHWAQAAQLAASMEGPNPFTRRAPVEGLPRALYNPDYLTEKGEQYATQVLHVSAEQFQWLDIVLEGILK